MEIPPKAWLRKTCQILHPKEILRNHRPEALKARFKPRQLIVSLLVSIMVVAIFMIQPYRIASATQTKSIDCMVFIWKKTDPLKAHFFQNDYVTFKFREGDLSPEYYQYFKKLRLVKKVGCAPGSYLDCSFGQCSCNGETISTAIDTKFADQAFQFQGVIPPDMMFLIGDNSVSYDGRYWGLTPITNLLGVVDQCLWWRDEEGE